MSSDNVTPQIKDTDPVGQPHEKFLLFISAFVLCCLSRGIPSIAMFVTHNAVSFMLARGEVKFKQTMTIKDIEGDLAAYEVIAFEKAKAADDRFRKYQEDANVKNKKLTKH